MKKRVGVTIATAFLAASLAFIPGVRAESDEFSNAAGDEGVPAWSVARLKAIEGSAWLLVPGESEWQEVDGNAPLSKGARIRVPEEASADLEFSSGDRVRLREGTDLELRDMRENRNSLILHEGDVRFRLPEDDFFTPMNVTLPGGQVVRFPKPGLYRIDATGDGEESVVRVKEGEARIKVGDVKYRVRAGEEAYVGEGVSIGRLTSADTLFDEPPPPVLAGPESTVEAPPEVVTELRDYGEWVSAPAYGVVWRPHVAAGWSPYRYGRWVWVPAFGWSWVSSEPWGWYPYRCGNWYEDPVFGWCWTPYRSFVSVSVSFGHRYYRPHHYYPATVRFVREPGAVRWVPLRPGERFSRPALPRTERTLTSWRQPMPRQTVFVREPAARGGEPPRWRDAHIDRPERAPASRPAPVVRSAPVERPQRAVRPGAPSGRGPEAVRPGSPGRQRPAVEQPKRGEEIRPGRGTGETNRQIRPPAERGGGPAVAPPSGERREGRPAPGSEPHPAVERAAPTPPRERPEVRTAPAPRPAPRQPVERFTPASPRERPEVRTAPAPRPDSRPAVERFVPPPPREIPEARPAPVPAPRPQPGPAVERFAPAPQPRERFQEAPAPSRTAPPADRPQRDEGRDDDRGGGRGGRGGR